MNGPASKSSPRKKRVLLTGATGFVGTHVHPALLERGYDVIGGTRHPEDARRNAPTKHFCQLDLADAASVERALQDVDVAIYLVHSMADVASYADEERRAAETFRDAVTRAGLDRVVYLGGMRPDERVSRHLKSRLETGETLRSGPVPVVEIQATMIVGGGSESFRIVRDLAARLPWMLLPKWLRSVSEPVAIDDVVAAIVHAVEMPLPHSEVLTAPGPEALSGREIILRTARALGQSPRVVEVPVVTPRLSSYWIRLVTRANPHVATELVEGLRSDIVSRGTSIWERMPEHRRIPFDEAVRAALREEEAALPAHTRVVEKILHRVAASH